MTIAYIAKSVIPAALWMLPEKMDSTNARVMLMAIGMQESKFKNRRQIVGYQPLAYGPARGWWMFEQGGIRGVQNHKASSPIINDVLSKMEYATDANTSHFAVEHNDILACIYARLLLYTDAKPLPYPGNEEDSWTYYVENWRPGKPHKEYWRDNYQAAMQAVV